MDTATEAIHATLRRAGADMGEVVGVGMGLPGPISRDSGTLGSSTILPAWVGLPVAAAMTERLGVPVFADNDANLGALAEVTFGAGRGFSEVAYLKVSSGIGAGLYMDGRIYRGGNGTAGEIGHVILDEDGLVCRCGNRGCLETLARRAGDRRRAAPQPRPRPRPRAGARARQAGRPRLRPDDRRRRRRRRPRRGEPVQPLQPAVRDRRRQPQRRRRPAHGPAARRRSSATPFPARRATCKIVPGELGARTETLGALALVIAESDRLVGSHSHPPAGSVVGA